MKIIVNRQMFLKSLNIVSKAISENKIRPIISGVYMEANNSNIILKGTNLELTVISKMSGEVVKGGVIVFSHYLVEEYLKEINDIDVILSIDDKLLLIETPNSISEFSIYDGSEYPQVRSIDGEMDYKISTENFINLLEKTKFSAAQISDDISINCIRMELENKVLKLISTDTYRLVCVTEPLDLEGELKVSIPLRSIDAIIKILHINKNEDAYLQYEGNQIKIVIGSTKILTRTIDLAFPDYDSILNLKGYDKKVVLNGVEFRNILKRVRIFVRHNSESKYSGTFNFTNNSLSISGVSEIAKINESMNITKTGDDLKISLNVKFLLDYLDFIERDKNIIINLSTSDSAIHLSEENSDSFKYLVMPLALRD